MFSWLHRKSTHIETIRRLRQERDGLQAEVKRLSESVKRLSHERHVYLQKYLAAKREAK